MAALFRRRRAADPAVQMMLPTDRIAADEAVQSAAGTNGSTLQIASTIAALRASGARFGAAGAEALLTRAAGKAATAADHLSVIAALDVADADAIRVFASRAHEVVGAGISEALLKRDDIPSDVLSTIQAEALREVLLHVRDHSSSWRLYERRFEQVPTGHGDTWHLLVQLHEGDLGSLLDAVADRTGRWWTLLAACVDSDRDDLPDTALALIGLIDRCDEVVPEDLLDWFCGAVRNRTSTPVDRIVAAARSLTLTPR